MPLDASVYSARAEPLGTMAMAAGHVRRLFSAGDGSKGAQFVRVSAHEQVGVKHHCANPNVTLNIGPDTIC